MNEDLAMLFKPSPRVQNYWETFRATLQGSAKDLTGYISEDREQMRAELIAEAHALATLAHGALEASR